MADEIPIIQQKTAIQPGGALPQVGAALAKKPGYQMDILKSSADFDYYTNYAAKASQELGATLGKERGERPGGFLIPPIFENQKSFHDAYKQEEFQNLNFEGQQSLQKMQILASRNPSKTSLAMFQKEGTLAVDELLEIASPGNQAELKRSLKGTYENAALNVSQANFNKERAERISQGNVRFDEAMKSVYNSAFNGDKELSQKDRDIAHRNIDGMVQSGLIDAELAYKRMDIIDNAQKTGELHAAVQEWTKDGTYAEKIRQFAENKPESMTPMKHQELLGSMQQHHSQFQSALNADQELAYMGTRNQIQGGVQMSPSQLEAAKEQMGPKNALHLDHDILAMNKKTNDTLNLVNGMTPDFGDVVKMSKWSDGDVDKVFNHYLGAAAQQAGVTADEIPLTAQTQLAAGFGAPITGIKNKVEMALKSGGMAQGAEALKALKFATDSNSPVLHGLNADAQGIGLLANKLMEGGNAVDEALLKAREQVLNKDDAKTAQLLKDFGSETGANASKNKNLNDVDESYKYAANTCGFDKGEIPPGFVDIFKTQLKANYLITGNLESAEKMTREKIRRTYGETEINGNRQVMYLPPEKFLPGGAGDIQRMREDLFEKSREVFKQSKEDFDKGLSAVWYEFPEKAPIGKIPLKAFIGLAPTKTPREYKVTRHDSFGDSVTGDLVISSNAKTSNPLTGITPNYSVELDINGLRAPIQMPANPAISMHYQPDFEKFQEKYKVTPERIEKAEERFKKTKEALEIVRETTLENQYE